MPFMLPVQTGKTDGSNTNENPRGGAGLWEQAAPDNPNGPVMGPHEHDVTALRTGPGDVSIISDQWMNPDIYVVPRQGVMNGEQLFKEIPDPPNEGHGEYGFAQDAPVIDHSTRRQALFWSDWIASTARNAQGAGSFTGEHVVIVRITPGSAQGYMPSDPGMLQYNTARAQPSPWDALLTIGTQANGG